jgi:hypothetical protein
LLLEKNTISVISGLRRKPDENHTLPGHYTASTGNFLLTFQKNLSVTTSESIEDGTDKLPRIVSKELPPVVT